MARVRACERGCVRRNSTRCRRHFSHLPSKKQNKEKSLTRKEVLKAESCLRVLSCHTGPRWSRRGSDGIDATCHVGGTAGLGGTFLPQVLICSTGPCRCICCSSAAIEESPASSHLPSVFPRLTPWFPGQTITFSRPQAAAP